MGLMADGLGIAALIEVRLCTVAQLKDEPFAHPLLLEKGSDALLPVSFLALGFAQGKMENGKESKIK